MSWVFVWLAEQTSLQVEKFLATEGLSINKEDFKVAREMGTFRLKLAGAGLFFLSTPAWHFIEGIHSLWQTLLELTWIFVGILSLGFCAKKDGDNYVFSVLFHDFYVAKHRLPFPLNLLARQFTISSIQFTTGVLGLILACVALALISPNHQFNEITVIASIFPLLGVFQSCLNEFGRRLTQTATYLYALNTILLWKPGFEPPLYRTPL